MNRVVITGIGALTPLGNDAPTTWKNAVAGTLGIGPITRFDDADLKTHVAGELKDFDPLDYLERSLLRKADLFAQYAMVAADEAIADAGGLKAIGVGPERFGAYVGSGTGGINTFYDNVVTIHERGPSRVSPHFITNMIINMAAAHVAMRFDLQGPCLPIVTACATGTNAIGEAFRAISAGQADAIIAGGAEAALHPLTFAGFINCQALALADDPTQASLPFDERRTGFVIGEGAGLVVLERADRAQARGAHIYAEVAGYGTTCDAYHLTAPNPEATTAGRAVALALDEAGLAGEEQLYINAHGTGTPLNDAMETKAFKLALGDQLAHKVLISSTKSMMGHTLGAAGGIEAIMAAKALETGDVPPTIGLSDPDPECDLDYVPGQARHADLVGALSTSFGFGGHNACLALRKGAL
ncbi:MAG: beta-ketoacyl-ACP synthase II [Coriobacteriia bacterium]|nr:beta-ketoacyl-ACP synthase II [Coriobacteriia bacterium]